LRVSEVAAILGFGVLRGIMGRHSIIGEQYQPDVRKHGQRRIGRDDVTIPALFILNQTQFDRL